MVQISSYLPWKACKNREGILETKISVAELANPVSHRWQQQINKPGLEQHVLRRRPKSTVDWTSNEHDAREDVGDTQRSPYPCQILGQILE